MTPKQLAALGACAAAAALAFALVTRQHAVHGAGSKLLRDFRVARVLKTTDSEVAILGHFYSDPLKRAAVLVLQKPPLDPSDLNDVFRSLSLHEILRNDIYSTFLGDVSRDIKPFKVTTSNGVSWSDLHWKGEFNGSVACLWTR